MTVDQITEVVVTVVLKEEEIVLPSVLASVLPSVLESVLVSVLASVLASVLVSVLPSVEVNVVVNEEASVEEVSAIPANMTDIPAIIGQATTEEIPEEWK